MNASELLARCHRLGEISRGLARELTLWEGTPYPMPFDSRKEYLDGLRAAIRGLEQSRVVLHVTLADPPGFATRDDIVKKLPDPTSPTD